MFPISSCAALLLLVGCGPRQERDDVVARAGDRMIERKELDRSFMLQPRWRPGQSELGAHLTQCEELIAQKVWAQEAERLGLDRDSLFQEHLRFLLEKEMIRALYRREVREKVHVDSNRVRQLYEWSKKKVDYEYVFCSDSLRCARYGQELATRPVGAMVFLQDSSVRVGKGEGTKVGDVPAALERLLFAGRGLGIRGPVRMAGGYVVVKVTGGTEEKFLSENEFILQRQKFENLLADRAADSISGAYVASMMQEKDLRLNAPVFWGVARIFGGRVREALVDPLTMQRVSVTRDELHLLAGDLRAMESEAVATHREGSLTVGGLLAALGHMPGSLRPRVRTPENLKAAIGMVVRNQYLLKEAQHQELGRNPEVQREYALQRDEALAMAYYTGLRDRVEVSAQEVEAFSRRSRVSEDQVFFKMNMGFLARDAKADSVLRSELPGLKKKYRIACDTAKIRSMLKTPDAILTEEPVKMFVREIFQ